MPISVRISEATSAALDSLVKATGKSKVKLLEEAVLAAEERTFWQGFEEGYAKQGDEFRAPLAATRAALSDGLPDEDEEAAWGAS